MPDDLTFDYTPGQPVTVGTTITIKAARAIDPMVAKEVVNIIHGSNPADLTITVNDKTISVPTTGLTPGYYDLVVGELLDTQGGRLANFTVRPLILKARGSQSKISGNFQIEHEVTLAFGDLSVRRLAPGEAKPPGTTIVQRIKAVNTDTGKFEDITLGENGERVDVQKLFNDLDERRFQKFGRIHENIWDHIQGKSEDNKVAVIVWPRLTGDHEMGDKSRSLEEFNATEEIFLTRVHSMRESIVKTLDSLNAHCLPEDRDVAPELRHLLVYVRASVTISQLKKLAEADHVGAVLLDDQSGISDLRDSINITRTTPVHQLGVTGKNVKVAVFEQGPSNTSNLVFADRYLSNPNSSDHARLVSAIVKNVQPGGPTGHAPDCDLYSANDYDNKALLWALSKGCTVITQSFHRYDEQIKGDLQADDILKDWLVRRTPYPVIVQAAGNFGRDVQPERNEYVNHKGYNSFAIGSHDDQAFAISGSSVYRNPTSPHGDRELPELCANGTGVTALGLTMSGTSFASPAVAGVVALMQSANESLKYWPEASRAILLAASNRKLSDSTWWADVATFKDVKVGAGALDAEVSYEIARNQVDRNNKIAIPDAWAGITLSDSDIDGNNISKFTFNMAPAGSPVSPLDRYKAKVALAWDSEVKGLGNTATSSKLTTDLDLVVKDSKDQTVASSQSFDNSYEVVDFNAVPGESYKIYVVRRSGSGNVYMGAAWRIEKTSWLLDRPGYAGTTAYLMSLGTSTIGSYGTTNSWQNVGRGATFSADLSFGAPSPAPPQVVTGINSIDMGNDSDYFWAIRVNAYADQITKDQFTIHLDSWADTKLYNARLSWFMLANTYSGVQCGSFNSKDYRDPNKYGNIYVTVKFAQKFSKPPVVYVGLSGWDIQDNWRIHLWTDNVKSDGFDIHIDTWGSSNLYFGRATWIAIDADMPGILTGEFKATENTPWSGSVTFAKPFVKIPAMFTAFTKFDISHFGTMRAMIKTTPTANGFNWAITPWGDSRLFQVSASWLALGV